MYAAMFHCLLMVFFVQDKDKAANWGEPERAPH